MIRKMCLMILVALILAAHGTLTVILWNMRSIEF